MLNQPSLVLLLTILSSTVFCASANTAGDDWFDDESELRALEVNEGELRFIEPVVDQPVLHSDTRLWLNAASRETGWVRLEQCYRHLDAVAKTQVVYAYREMRDLQITRAEHIRSARVAVQSIELEDVTRGAVLCVRSEVRILLRRDAATYVLQNGPYHRRFLDGYYPYHVSLAIDYGDSGLVAGRIDPDAQAGLTIVKTPVGVAMDAWFEGNLTLEIELKLR